MNRTLFAVLLPALACACSRIPEGVLHTEQLASLLCDIQITESYYSVEGIPGVPRAGLEENDSVKKVLLQGVLARHGVSRAEFERTLDWYGHNLDRYEDVCERTGELIEQRRSQLISTRKGQNAGDDLWRGPLMLYMSGTTSRTMACYNLTAEGVNKGDRIEWSFSTTALTAPIEVVMAVDYTDGTTSLRTHRIAGEGRQQLPLQLDSTLTPTRLYGYLRVAQRTPLLLDSITLRAQPLSPARYYDIHSQPTRRP